MAPVSWRALRLPLVLALSVGLSACAAQPRDRVIVDMQGVNQERYRVDVEDCAEYAGIVNVEGQVVRGAAGGAALYGVIGAIFAGSEGAARGAGAGGVLGAARGGMEATREQTRVMRNCLRGRGYRVLN
ncbi:MAG: hypothetical protein V2J24_20390 [Pseudomonadales bacterium]|jgi:hypothetical protein|nr:hypothetical protein [Pseudomonadales bacterium]